MKILAMADIHGRLHHLTALLTPEKISVVDKVVLLGDYVGYGDQSVEVVCWLLSLKERLGEKLVLLRGNWEIMLYSALTGWRNEIVDGKQSLDIMSSRHNFQNSIVPFLRNQQARDVFLRFFNMLDDFYVPMEGGWCFVHAGIDVSEVGKATTAASISMALDHSDEYSRFWLEEPDLPPLASLPFKIVCGHIPFSFLHGKESPYTNGNYINIDFRASSNYGRLGYVIIDTVANRKTYCAVPIDAGKYALAKKKGWSRPKQEISVRPTAPNKAIQDDSDCSVVLRKITPHGGNGSISWDEAMEILLGGCRW